MIQLNEARIGVVEACSGLSMLITFIALSTAAALVVKRPLLERLVLVASSIPVALLANIARITLTGILHETVGGHAASTFYHDLAGWLMIPFALILYWFEISVFTRLLIEIKYEAPPLLYLGRFETSDNRNGEQRSQAIGSLSGVFQVRPKFVESRLLRAIITRSLGSSKESVMNLESQSDRELARPVSNPAAVLAAATNGRHAGSSGVPFRIGEAGFWDHAEPDEHPQGPAPSADAGLGCGHPRGGNQRSGGLVPSSGEVQGSGPVANYRPAPEGSVSDPRFAEPEW